MSEKDYKDENTWLMHGDCLERMKEIPDGSVELIICDPPYKMTKRGKSCRPNWMPDNMGDNVFKTKLPKPVDWLREYYRVMSDNSHLYIFTNTISLQEYLNESTNAGFKLHNIISMIKDTGMPNRWYYKQTELVLFLRKGKAKPINDYTSRDNINVVMPKKRAKNGEEKLHVTQKPLSFIETLVCNSSIEGDTVLDSFSGSFTTGIACRNLNRKFIGIEMDDNYLEIGKKRLGVGDD